MGHCAVPCDGCLTHGTELHRHCRRNLHPIAQGAPIAAVPKRVGTLTAAGAARIHSISASRTRANTARDEGPASTLRARVSPHARPQARHNRLHIQSRARSLHTASEQQHAVHMIPEGVRGVQRTYEVGLRRSRRTQRGVQHEATTATPDARICAP